jgi:hypothetical protein
MNGVRELRRTTTTKCLNRAAEPPPSGNRLRHLLHRYVGTTRRFGGSCCTKMQWLKVVVGTYLKQDLDMTSLPWPLRNRKPSACSRHSLKSCVSLCSARNRPTSEADL